MTHEPHGAALSGMPSCWWAVKFSGMASGGHSLPQCGSWGPSGCAAWWQGASIAPLALLLLGPLLLALPSPQQWPTAMSFLLLSLKMAFLVVSKSARPMGEIQALVVQLDIPHFSLPLHALPFIQKKYFGGLIPRLLWIYAKGSRLTCCLALLNLHSSHGETAVFCECEESTDYYSHRGKIFKKCPWLSVLVTQRSLGT